MAAHQAPPSLGFSRQEHWSRLPPPSPVHESEKWKWSRSVVSDSSRPHGLQPTRLLHPWDSPGKSTGVGCHCLLHSYPRTSINRHNQSNLNQSVFNPNFFYSANCTNCPDYKFTEWPIQKGPLGSFIPFFSFYKKKLNPGKKTSFSTVAQPLTRARFRTTPPD